VLLALVAVIVTGLVLGRIFLYLGQPPVIGEVVAGILLGPSLLGRLAPEALAFVLPGDAAPFLGLLAQVGVVLYLFLVGLELNLDRLRAHAQATIVISHASIVVPFVLGSALALWLYPLLAPAGVPFTAFALFMGIAMAITAFPVLARILTDRRLDRTDLGLLALSCAAINDVTAWCLLAFVVGVAQADLDGAAVVLGLTAAYLIVMLGIVRPFAFRWASRFRAESQVTPGNVAVVLVALLLSAVATEAIGIHAMFGAFVLGAIIPHDSAIPRVFGNKLHELVTILFLPAFFAYTGLRTEIGLVAGAWLWLVLGVIVLVATLGKFGGTFAAARLTGLGHRDATALGLLMNTRGLMELIILNVGLDLGIISPTLFALMVLMALFTTLATAPLLQRLVPALPR
jgi:Kef-type K+ transport system membrane component KefB